MYPSTDWAECYEGDTCTDQAGNVLATVACGFVIAHNSQRRRSQTESPHRRMSIRAIG